MKLDILDSQRHLKTATRILRQILSTDKEFEKKVRIKISNSDYLLDRGKKECKAVLVAFFGAYGGYGVVLLANEGGPPILGVSFHSLQSDWPTLWKGTHRLPKEFAKVLSTLKDEKEVREIFKRL